MGGWRSAHPNLDPPERIELSALGAVADEQITLDRFAKLIGKDLKTVTQHKERVGFPGPGPGPDERYRLEELLAYWNARTGRRGKASRSPNHGYSNR